MRSIVSMKGGFGNQLFQYSFGEYLRQQGNRVWYDVSWYRSVPANDTLRSLNREIFGPGDTIFGSRVWWWAAKVLRRRQWWKIRINTERTATPSNAWINVYEGYWQELQYAAVARTILTRRLIDNRGEAQVDAIGIHVRGGDYRSAINRAMFIECGREYYINALQRLSVSDRSLPIYVFSDDREYCRHLLDGYLPNARVTYVKLQSDLDEWRLLARCQTVVIPNSTFSWWAAFLGQKPKRVICPTRWRGDGDGASQLIPADWISV